MQIIQSTFSGQDIITYIDSVSASLTYIGDAAIGSVGSTSVWRILRITKAGTVTKIEWADGDTNFNNQWDNRASLNYS